MLKFSTIRTVGSLVEVTHHHCSHCLLACLYHTVQLLYDHHHHHNHNHSQSFIMSSRLFVLKSVIATTPKGKSLASMALASAAHCAGYEFARNSVIGLFTSQRTGFASSAAMPAATGFISPFSIALLWVRNTRISY